MTAFKCNTCKFYKFSSRCECCFENEHYEENKYRWHDLRKNHEDLPNPLDDSIMYDCVLENHIYDACYPSFYFDKEHTKQFGLWNSSYAIANGADDFCTIEDLGYEKVIAWREIEPFEEAAK